MYFMLTGHAPFNEGTVTMRLAAHQSKQPPPIQDKRSDVPDSLLAIVDQMLEKKPSDRYQSCAELADALTKWLTANAGDSWRPQKPGASIHDETRVEADPDADTAVGKTPLVGKQFDESDLSIIGKSPPRLRYRTPLVFAALVIAFFLAGFFSLQVWRAATTGSVTTSSPQSLRNSLKAQQAEPKRKLLANQRGNFADAPNLLDDQDLWQVTQRGEGKVSLYQETGSAQKCLLISAPNEESQVRVDFDLENAIIDQPFAVQVDWRANHSSKSCNILTLAGLDINAFVFKIQSSGGKNQFKLSDADIKHWDVKEQCRLIKQPYEVFHWYRFVVSVEPADLKRYHIKIIAPGA